MSVHTSLLRPLGFAALCAFFATSVTAQEERVPNQNDIQSFSARTLPSPPQPGVVFGTENLRTYLFPGLRDDLADGVYWNVTGHGSGNNRDISATRFDQALGTWTRKHPESAGLSGHRNSLIWDIPVYSPASGIILTCWRNAPDGADPGEAGCGDNPTPGAACLTPSGGNHVNIWVPEERRLILMAHFKQGSVPETVCPFDNVQVEDWFDKSGPFGFNPEIVLPFPFIQIEEGDLIGHVGNSGRSGGPHLHAAIRECPDPLDRTTCRSLPFRFDRASVAQKVSGRDIRDDEWVRLNGTLSVIRPRQVVLPDGGIDDFEPVQPPVGLRLEQDAIGFAQVSVDVTNPADPVSNFDWEAVEPTTTILEDQATIGWTMEATCLSGIQSLSLTSPGENRTQTFPEGRINVSARFETQSFSTEELRDICLDWAQTQSQSVLCNQAPELCREQELFDLIGGSGRGTAFSDVSIRMQCRDGQTIEVSGMPELSLRCGAVPFGFAQ